jgi:hypothetical protein
MTTPRRYAPNLVPLASLVPALAAPTIKGFGVLPKSGKQLPPPTWIPDRRYASYGIKKP